MLQIYLLSILTVLAFAGCSSAFNKPQQEEPEFCKEFDKTLNPSIRELCASRKLRFKGYKNFPEQRFLIKPKNTYLVKSDDQVEIRLPDTQPVLLGTELGKRLDFSKSRVNEMIKNKYYYTEKFIGKGKRVRAFKISIPVDDGSIVSYCFSIPTHKPDERRFTIEKNRVELTKCSEFDALVKIKEHF